MAATTAAMLDAQKAPKPSKKAAAVAARKQPARQWLSADGLDVPMKADVKTIDGAPGAHTGTVTTRHAGGSRLSVTDASGKTLHIDPAHVTIVA